MQPTHRTAKAVKTDVRDHVSPEDLNVAPALIGLPLASPARRLLAIIVDVALVGLLSSVGNLWLLAGVALAAALGLRWRPVAASAPRRWLAGLAAAALLGFGAQQAWTEHANGGSEPDSAAGERSAADEPEAGSEAAALRALPPAQRIAALEAALEAARHPAPLTPLAQARRWADSVGIGFAWAIVHFTLLPARWNGQTLGKRLFGLRIVELTGKPLTVSLCLKRYGGYAAGMATGMLGFAQVFWDSNRQAIQDKTAHTVVIDLRARP